METNQLQSLITESLNSNFDKIFSSTTQSTDIFEEIPVDFRTFVTSKEHMEFPPLSDRQLAVMDFMLGKDSTKIFDNGNNLAVLEFGKGSGKDLISVLTLLYIVYWLLCLKNPQAYFGMGSGESIDCLNVACNEDQARDIFFEKFKQRLLLWKWLKDKYHIKVSGIHRKSYEDADFKNVVAITKDSVKFPKLIRLFSGNSEDQSQEGLSLICWILDEAAGFDSRPTSNTADKIFNMLRSSSVSRFGSRGKGFILSFPRYKGDFIERMYDMTLGELHMYGDKAATWEVKPAHCFKDYPKKYFEFEGHHIPLEFEEDFRRDPTEAKTKFLCSPPDIQEAFIEYPEKVDASINTDKEQIILLQDYYEANEVRKRVVGWNSVYTGIEHIMTIDLGVKNDAAAMSIFHKEKMNEKLLIVQDLVTAWIPNKEQSCIVSFHNIEEIIKEIKSRINLVGVYFDQWSSDMLIEGLNKASIPSVKYKLTFDDYKNFKEKLYLGNIKLLYHERMIQEIKQLKLFRGEKVDHGLKGSKDLADTVVGGVKILGGHLNTRKSSGINLFTEGEFIVENVGSFTDI